VEEFDAVRIDCKWRANILQVKLAQITDAANAVIVSRRTLNPRTNFITAG
jgi:hypothetical protein